jgi:hypothetical protein
MLPKTPHRSADRPAERIFEIGLVIERRRFQDFRQRLIPSTNLLYLPGKPQITPPAATDLFRFQPNRGDYDQIPFTEQAQIRANHRKPRPLCCSHLRPMGQGIEALIGWLSVWTLAFWTHRRSVLPTRVRKSPPNGGRLDWTAVPPTRVRTSSVPLNRRQRLPQRPPHVKWNLDRILKFVGFPAAPNMIQYRCRHLTPKPSHAKGITGKLRFPADLSATFCQKTN